MIIIVIILKIIIISIITIIIIVDVVIIIIIMLLFTVCFLQPVPYLLNIPGGMYPGRMIFFSGKPNSKPSR